MYPISGRSIRRQPVENVTYLGKGMEAIGTVNLAADKTFSGMKKKRLTRRRDRRKGEELEAEETEVMELLYFMQVL